MIVAGFAVAAIDVTGFAATLVLLMPSLLLMAAIVYAHRSASLARLTKSRRSPAAVERFGVMMAADGAFARVDETRVAEVSWAERIQKAEAAGDAVEVAGLYLAWARDEVACGQAAEAGEHLRTTVRIATKSKAAALHAEARLELAELAREAGDLTTACEHWQLARALFHDLTERERVGETERLMQRHGCPTDWVLNDF